MRDDEDGAGEADVASGRRHISRSDSLDLTPSPPLLRHGPGEGRPHHRVLRRPAPLRPPALGADDPSLPRRAARPSKRHHPPRPQTLERAGRRIRRQARPQSDRLRRGQGHRPAAHRTHDVHPVRPDRRHVRIHEPRAGPLQPARRRHPQRHLFAGRVAVRAVGRQHAAGKSSACDTAAFDEILRIIREEDPPRPSTPPQQFLPPLCGEGQGGGLFATPPPSPPTAKPNPPSSAKNSAASSTGS